MADLYQREGEKLRIELHPGQVRAWDSAARFTFIIAGTQGGKTSFEPIWLDREIQRCGRGDYIAATATYDLFKLKFLPEMMSYFVDIFGWEYSASDRVIWRKDKPKLFTRIILRSANAPGGLESSTGKAAVLDECGQDEFRLESWEAILRRLSLSQGRVLGGTTPYNLGWLKTQVYDKWRAGDDDFRVIQFKSIMNPAFPMAEYERARRTLPSWKFEMFYNGEFSRPAGLIYEDFTDWHKCKPFDVPPHWPRFLGVDFGAVHTAKLYAAQDPETGIYYVIDDPLEGGLTTSQHVQSVKSHRYYQQGLNAYGGAASEEQQRWDWNAAGLFVGKPNVSDVEAGIDRVIKLLKEKRLRVFETCAGLLDELGTYSREIDAMGQPTEKIKDKSTFHRIDALRYFAVGIGDSGWMW